ncbi:heterokaryon incompatibility protein [Chaetomium sp. MPI-CAGE-AT-0009]|nr:heterokaryon incompatibility protein [Chaetomium sp. MPI-CAGE-AT-0009]
MLCPHAQLRADRDCVCASITVTACQSSAKTCQECDLLLRVVEEYKPGWLNTRCGDSGLTRALYLSYRDASEGAVQLKEGREERWHKLVGSFTFFRKAKGDILLSLRKTWPFLPVIVPHESLEVVRDSSSAAAFERASKWLAHCVDHDETCKIPNTSFTPRRLLNVGTTEQSREPFLFKPTVPVLYACLSYCWGADATDVLTTTTHNLQAHCQAVPLVAMPQTIRDAVTVCRALKLENLWVDSLCIIQDDPKDWLQQSSEMRDIYANSHLAVVAEEPASCKLGFLGEQQFGSPRWQRVFTTHVPEEAGGPGNQVILRPIEEGETTPDHRYERCSLDKRGWCLQESVLPSRRLRFNGKEMSWECGSRGICECGHLLLTGRPIPYGKLGRKIKEGYGETPWEATPGDDWRDLVEEYSKRCLTKKTDKLSAISGLAKLLMEAPQKRQPEIESGIRVPRLTADDYKAGLWKSTFISDLAWRVVPPGLEDSGPIPYRAPSWSWASVDGPVQFPSPFPGREHVDELSCTVDDVICETIVPSDPTGPVKAAYAFLTGPLVIAELVDPLPALDDGKGDGGEWLAAHPSCVRGKNLYSVEVALDQPREVFKDRVHCLRLFTREERMTKIIWSQTIPSEVWFLVLQRSSRDEAAFERIGVGFWLIRNRRDHDPNDPNLPVDLPLFDGAETSSIKIV